MSQFYEKVTYVFVKGRAAGYAWHFSKFSTTNMYYI